MSLRFTEQYYPDIDVDLTDEQLAVARQQVVLDLQPVMPDVDLSPGTLTGDMVITPLAVRQAVSDESMSRLMSDTNLANVADGIIFSCDFVRAYLGNFSVYDVENLKATGIVRLSYSNAEERQVDRSLRFRFGTDDDWYLRTTNPDAESITLLPPGSAHTGADDTYILAQTSATTWAVDLPVEGDLTSPVLRAATGAATQIDDDLVGIVAAITFMSGVPSASLPDLARQARRIASSLTAGSRSSAQALVYRNWPETTMASAIIPGDSEMQRSEAGTAMALQRPAIDLYLRSSRDMQQETQIVRLDYIETDAGARVFRGALPLLHRPSRITSIEWSGTTSDSLVTSAEVFSKTSREDLYGSLHCGTRYEQLFIEIIPEVDDVDLPLIPLSEIVEDEVTTQYAYFAIEYDADPLLDAVSSTLESTDYRPVGVDLLVKSGPLVSINDLVITFSRKAGTQTTLNVARDRIVEYFRTAGYPDPFRQTELLDIMRNSGVDRVINIEALGVVTVSAAGRLLRDTLDDPGVADIAGDWAAESDELRILPVVTAGGITPHEIIDGEISSGGPPDAWAATGRTVRYYVDSDNIRFIEA